MIMKTLNITQRDFSLTSLSILAIALLCINSSAFAQDAQSTIAPPSLGQETKGTPAYEERAPLPKKTIQAKKAKELPSEKEAEQDILGTASITESRRENGQVYEVEIDHSLGGKQYFEKNGSDDSLETTPQDLEDTPNLPKWKLGTW